MRPVLIIPATLVLIAAVAVAYFAGQSGIQSDTLTRDQGYDVTLPSASLNVMGPTPLTFSYSNNPRGSALWVFVCPSKCPSGLHPDSAGTSVLQSTDFNGTSGSYTFQLSGTQSLQVVAARGGVDVQTSYPLWAVYSTVFLILLIATFAVAIVGILLRAPGEKPPTPKQAEPSPPPRSAPRSSGQPRYAGSGGSQWPPPPMEPEAPAGYDPNAPYSHQEWQEV